jgi:hypothetical protein
MKTRLLLLLPVAALTASVLSGCVFAVGVPNSELRPKPTLGRQLSDLKQARDSGAITEEEYQTAKKRLIEEK